MAEDAFQRMLEVIDSLEQKLQDAYSEQVGLELAAVDGACALLALVLESVGKLTAEVKVDQDGVPVGGDVGALKLHAIMVMGVRALRVVRAGRATLAAGYESEALAHDRILVELATHRREIIDDKTAKVALDWLAGKRGHGITDRVNAMNPADLYKNLCHESHGDPVPVLRLMAEHGEAPVMIGPKRTAKTRACLLMYAGFLRDQAVLTAKVVGIQLDNVAALDRQITDGWGRLDQEAADDE